MNNSEIFERYLETKELLEMLRLDVECELEERNISKNLIKEVITESFDFRLDLLKEDLEETTGIKERDLYLERLKNKVPQLKTFSAEEQKAFNERVEKTGRNNG